MGQTANDKPRPKKGEGLEKLYQSVTDMIIRHLEEGVPTWTRPWTVSGKNGIGIVPANAMTGRPYSGINIFLLWAAAEQNSYPTNGWLTYQQANKLGGKIRKGEKSTTVTYVKFIEKDERDDNGRMERRKVPMTRLYSVFNVAQCENLPPAYLAPPTELPEGTPYANLRDCIQQATGHTRERPKILYAGSKAAYMPNRDVIVMPPYGSFQSEEEFYATLAHETVHFSGAEGRLNRRFGKRFGDETYAAEELVAEMGSAFLCAHFGARPVFRSAQYIANWLTVLKNDNRAIFTAASYASQASTWVLDHGGALEDADDDEQLEAAE